MSAPLFDSGVLFAALDRADRWHARSVALISEASRPPQVPVTALPEVCYFARKVLGAAVERTFIADVADGAFAVEDLEEDDFARVHELLTKYPDIGFVDASVVAIAERLRIDTLATVDRRHFSSIRPRHVQSFTLVP